MTTKEQQQKYSKKWYYKDVERSRRLGRENYKRNRKRQRQSSINWQKRNYQSWIDYLPNEAPCGLCGKTLYLITEDRSKKIYFDHTKEDCAIKRKPSDFLNTRKCNEENIQIWESCNFGILCRWCNMCIPTKNRMQWLCKLILYISKYK